MNGNIHEARKKFKDSPDNDFYQTPKCVTWELLNNYLLDNVPKDHQILDPCCGLYAIGNELKKVGYKHIAESDISYGIDFFKNYDATKEHYNAIVMNPPFKNFDAFIKKAKEMADVVCSVGRLNFFGAHNRHIGGLWNHLKYILVFDRQLAYDRPFREDGKVECGMLISCWFIWDKSYTAAPMVKLVDMQKYIVTKKDLQYDK